MKKKIIKSITGFITIALTILLVYGIFSGNLERYVHKHKDKTKSQDNKKENSQCIKEYPPGQIIENYKKAFSWDFCSPKEDVYDPNNKNISIFAYGVSKDESDYNVKLSKEATEYNQKHPLDQEHTGLGKVNKENLIEIGKEFDNKIDCVKVTVNSLEVIDNIIGLDENYFLPNVKDKELVNSYDECGNLREGVVLIDCDTQETLDNQKLKFIKINLTVKSYSNWVHEFDITPEFRFYKDENDYLLKINTYSAKIDKGYESYSNGYPMYFDLGSYKYGDFKNKNINDTPINYPMRLGDEVTFNAIYVCPEKFINNAYLAFGSNIGATEKNPNTYNDSLHKLIKIII